MGLEYFDYLNKDKEINFFNKLTSEYNLDSSIQFYRENIDRTPRDIIIACRRLSEAILRNVASSDKNVMKDTSSFDFNKLIQFFQKVKFISNDLAVVFHSIRKKGNEAAHDSSKQFYAKAAEEALIQLDLILRAFANNKTTEKPLEVNNPSFDMRIVSYDSYDKKIIYIQTADNSDGLWPAYEGLEKIGDASINDWENDLSPNSDYIRSIATNRIKQYMTTAGVPFNLQWAQLALNNNNKYFRDFAVHGVLKRSGYSSKNLGNDNGDPQEWFKVSLETAKEAIKAVKEGKLYINKDEEKTAIEFRPEQEKAIKKTLKIFKNENEMLWNAKMRFGKTLCALEVARRAEYNKTLIITHRPVVNDGWFDDFNKIFNENVEYGSKTKGTKIENIYKGDKPFIYFASLQDLRGSNWAGGTQGDKNREFLEINWDFIIIDEAHEGNETELANQVKSKLINDNTKILELSGTPFNLIDKYDEDNIFTWDYTMEQKAKEEWYIKNPNTINPYADLPRVSMYTFEIPKEYNFFDETKSFNFKEFFRTDENENFIYHNDVVNFLDYITIYNHQTNFPYSTEKFRNNLRHTLWLLPGVKEAKALEKILNEHQVFKEYEIVNVVRDGDSEYGTQADLDKVRKAISKNPAQTKTITLTVRKLTTGVTIPEWSGVLFLSNTESPTTYLQAAFRAQTPFNHKDMGIKENCYIFDFAPDRALKIMVESVGLTNKKGKINSLEQKERLQKLLNFLPVLGNSNNRMKPFSVDNMLTQLKKVYAEKAVKSGFEDNSLYNDNLLNLDEAALEKFKDLKGIIGAKEKTLDKQLNLIINDQGFNQEEYEKNVIDLEKKPKRERTEEEQLRIDLLKNKRKQRKAMISILRGVSVRIPMMIYGMNVDINEDITIDKFIDKVDEKSWEEFMPKGLSKDKFKDFIQYYDSEVFIEAGRIIRLKAKSYDNLDYIERTIKIAELFSSFKNPDKETVLTPWRVVNMQLISCLGGYSFYDDAFINTTVDGIDTGRWVDTKETKNIYNKNNAFLDINAKNGLYPLFVAISMYYKMFNEENEKYGKVSFPEKIWKDILKNNIYVLAKTPMAATIAKRTLSGYKDYEVNIKYVEDLVFLMKESNNQVTKKISEVFNDMKFDVIIGNPPYQNKSKQQIYTDFYLTSVNLANIVCLIFPTGWQEPKDANNLKKMNNKKIKEDRQIVKIDIRKNVFPGVPGAELVNIVLWKKDYDNGLNGKQLLYFEGENPTTKRLITNQNEIKKPQELIDLFNSINDETFKPLSSITSKRNPYGLSTNIMQKQNSPIQSIRKESTDIEVWTGGRGVREIKYLPFNYAFTKRNNSLKKYKVFVPYAWGNMDEKSGLGGAFSDIIIAGPNVVTTETWLESGSFDDFETAQKHAKYLMTKFVRALLYLNKFSQHSTTSWSAIPVQDYLEGFWNLSIEDIDMHLIKKYNINQNISDFIDKNIQKKTEKNIVNFNG